jgi:hypothetical protein
MLRNKTSAELTELGEDIERNTMLLSQYTDINSRIMQTQELEIQVTCRDAILQEQGEKLASLARTRWYNEGEKSNKYFSKST